MNDDNAVSPRDEETIVTKKLVAEHKLFYLDFKRNQRGKFLKITEKDGRFRSTVIIPEEAVHEFAHVIGDLAMQYAAPPDPAASATSAASTPTPPSTL